jgi:NTE family protein
MCADAIKEELGKILLDPATYLDTEEGGPQPGIALCLSGGGYRAAVFHVGAIWRLHEAGLLAKTARISSVSGGSITAGVLGLNWNLIKADGPFDKQAFVEHFVKPVRAMAGETIDRWAIIGGALLPGSISEKIQAQYKEHLFGEATLQDLPDTPRIIFNATNVQTSVLWRFSKKYMADYRVGMVDNPEVSLAEAVAASSAFPPVLSPMVLRLEPEKVKKVKGNDLHKEPYTTKVILTDGGVYDNLGLETAWKKYKTVFISDAGGQIKPEEDPKDDWARHSYRVLNLIDNQVRCLRKRQVIYSYLNKRRTGAYWGIRTNIENYKLADAMPCPEKKTLDLADTPTRLKRLDGARQEKLINWGYAVCDAAIRKHYDKTIAKPAGFPYPKAKV